MKSLPLVWLHYAQRLFPPDVIIVLLLPTGWRALRCARSYPGMLLLCCCCRDCCCICLLGLLPLLRPRLLVVAMMFFEHHLCPQLLPQSFGPPCLISVISIFHVVH